MVAGQIWQILQISAGICRVRKIMPGSANSMPKFHSKKLAKVCSCLNGIFSEIAVEFNFEGGRANLANPTNFSGNMPDSPDFARFRKF
jgi:hypothetical protein